MELSATADVAVASARVLAEVADLASYPHWLGIVHRVEPEPFWSPDPGLTPGIGGPEPAWRVEVGARLGPFKRTKRVRMVRVALDDRSVRFERAERDGRDHSPWVMRAGVEPVGDSTRLTIQLHYGGSAWLPGLDLVLAQEVRRAGSRLEARLL